jgi:hypothetical protein
MALALYPSSCHPFFLYSGPPFYLNWPIHYIKLIPIAHCGPCFVIWPPLRIVLHPFLPILSSIKHLFFYSSIFPINWPHQISIIIIATVQHFHQISVFLLLRFSDQLAHFTFHSSSIVSSCHILAVTSAKF